MDRSLLPAPLVICLLSVFAFLFLPALSSGQQQDQPGKIPESPPIPVRGTVRNALTGEPLPRALVRVEGDANTGALTDGDGHFELAVPPGPQSIRLQKPGYHDRSYASEDAGGDQDGPPHSVMVSDDMPELEFKLTPSCVISGRIELSTGDPAQGMTIVLLKHVIHSGRAVWAQVTTTRANGDGGYRFAGLPAGPYIVYTQPTLETEPAVTAVAAGQKAGVTRAGFPAVFFPDARDFSGAGRIQLSDGQQATANMLLTLEPFYSVAAVGVLAGTGSLNSALPPGNSAMILDAAGHLLPYTAQYDDATHSIQANLPDGSYMLLMHGMFPAQLHLNEQSGLSARRRAGPAQFSGMVEFTIAGHPLDGLRVPLGPPHNVAVAVRYLHTGVVPTATRPAASDDSNAPILLGAEQADGLPVPDVGGSQIPVGEDSFDISVPWPGTYWFSAYIPQTNLCVDSLKSGGANLAREPLALSSLATSAPMELTLRDDCAQFALTLPQGLAQFEPGEEPFYTVYVVPDFDSVEDIPPMAMHPSSGPTLNVDGLTPGSYHVYTFTSPVRLEYHNPAALAALPNPGQQITLAPGGSGSLVLEVPAQ